ncbi:matrixin family metalloprotease [Paenibacillus sp. EC2-1]|uniref:matrixin family metalloprotease n=1 Tax=Paenibacillus sp. EC2-1 TaxID=3388665 RepID=UPI003BEEFC5F
MYLKKTKLGIKISLIVAFLLCVLFPVNSYAYTIYKGKWFDGNNLEAWLDSSVSQAGFDSHSKHGSLAWNNSSHIQVSMVSKSSDADIKWFASFTDLGEMYAGCLNYSGGTPDWTGLYSDSRIRWNQPRAKNLDANRLKETATHEVGHSLGLDHSKVTDAIMKPKGWIYGTYPIKDDWDGINYIYTNL